MTTKLLFSAIIKLLLGILLVGSLVFLPAGSLHFFGGMLLMGTLFVPMTITGIFLMLFSPDLLKKRLESKEKEKNQSVLVKLSGIMFVIGFVVAGLDFRFSVLPMPLWTMISASVVLIFGYVLYGVVLFQNRYLSRTIKVENGQELVDTGLYSVVRHPMYLATILMFLAIPMVLGSVISLAVFLFYPAIIVVRIIGEEKILEKQLFGYAEYKKKVKYRLIPFVW